jgi:pimeloyl-ACP methyl ester carboxylesterase
MKLFYREEGGDGPNLIILHGLFGSSDNWLPQARMLADVSHVYLVDLRNHGQSPHSNEFNYDVMADDVAEFIEAQGISSPLLLGHSMGGKTAMTLALRNPDLPSGIIVVDVAPRQYPNQHDKIVEGLLAMPLSELKSRQDADEALSPYEPEPAVRQFLLKNLKRESSGGFSWKMNLDVISRNISEVARAVGNGSTFPGPALFLRGARSPYIADGDLKGIRRLFPAAKLETFDTGHWIQAEKPRELVDRVKSFLAGLK